jgi:hypothetical protein
MNRQNERTCLPFLAAAGDDAFAFALAAINAAIFALVPPAATAAGMVVFNDET